MGRKGISRGTAGVMDRCATTATSPGIPSASASSLRSAGPAALRGIWHGTAPSPPEMQNAALTATKWAICPETVRAEDEAEAEAEAGAEMAATTVASLVTWLEIVMHPELGAHAVEEEEEAEAESATTAISLGTSLESVLDKR